MFDGNMDRYFQKQLGIKFLAIRLLVKGSPQILAKE